MGQVKESDDLDAIMNVLAQADPEPVLHSVGQFLSQAERSDGAPWETLPATEVFIERVWAVCATEEVYVPGAESNRHWVSKTINEPAGLLKHLDAFDEDQARRWASLLASIAVRCEASPASSWVDEMTAKAGPEERARWIEALGNELEEVDRAVRAAVWDAWLAEYWTRRTRSVPAVVSQAEADALAVLAPHLPAEQFAAAVTLVEATSARLDSHGEASRNVSDELIDACGVEVGRFLTHLMMNTSGQFWNGYDLVPKLKRLVAKSGDWKGRHQPSKASNGPGKPSGSRDFRPYYRRRWAA